MFSYFEETHTEEFKLREKFLEEISFNFENFHGNLAPVETIPDLISL